MSTSTPLYRKPMTPGYLGTYNWRSTLLGLLLFITTNIITTQHIAAHFDYQPCSSFASLRAESRPAP